RELLLSLREPTNLSDPVGPAWVEEAGRDFTALGGKAVLTLVTVAVVGHLLLRRKPRSAVFVAISVVGGALLSSALKGIFVRPRPALVTHLAYVTSSSFPSGHSMLSSAVYLTLAGLLARSEASLVRKAYILLWATILALLVGFSRVYIGVHWPSDVLAGWAAGAAWAAFCWTVARALQRSGDVEPPEPSPADSSQEERADSQ
ncbi:MAG TPA: phosphatase PAP2 family protein, partial [Polyangiaceae bacterium]|nr:phosphatase PAP2 family protein [Polyangiaceae bacterium]